MTAYYEPGPLCQALYKTERGQRKGKERELKRTNSETKAPKRKPQAMLTAKTKKIEHTHATCPQKPSQQHFVTNLNKISMWAKKTGFH